MGVARKFKIQKNVRIEIFIFTSWFYLLSIVQTVHYQASICLSPGKKKTLLNELEWINNKYKVIHILRKYRILNFFHDARFILNHCWYLLYMNQATPRHATLLSSESRSLVHKLLGWKTWKLPLSKELAQKDSRLIKLKLRLTGTSFVMRETTWSEKSNWQKIILSTDLCFETTQGGMEAGTSYPPSEDKQDQCIPI